MNSLDGIDYEAINAAIARCNSGPYIDVVDRDAPVPLHLFHFNQENRPELSPIIYAHRNGHGSMIAKLKDGGYRLCKYWKNPEEVNAWPTRFERLDPTMLYDMVTIGEGETLTMLPLKAYPVARGRVVAYREHLLNLHANRNNDTFQIAYDGGSGPRVMSPAFSGKAWESVEAVEWCHKMVPSFRAEADLKRVNLTASTATFGDLEDHPLAFMF